MSNNNLDILKKKNTADPLKSGIGLVLAGGGTKGAYEIGAWKALLQTGIAKQITGFSGSSIGAFNSALLAVNDLDLSVNIWNDASLFDFVNLNKDMILKKISDGMSLSVKENLSANIHLKSAGKKAFFKVAKGTFEKTKSGLSSAKNSVVSYADPRTWGQEKAKEVSPYKLKYNNKPFRNFSIWFMKNLFGSGYATPERLRAILEKNIFFDDQRMNDIDVFSTVCEWDDTHHTSGTPRYICWSGLNRDQIFELISISSSLPVLYPEKKIGDVIYVDGGYADNEPVKPLYDIGYRKIIIIYLDKYKGRKLKKIIKEQETVFPGTEFLRLIPSKEFDDGFTRSCIISKKITEERMTHGYDDCTKLIKSYF